MDKTYGVEWTEKLAVVEKIRKELEEGKDTSDQQFAYDAKLMISSLDNIWQELKESDRELRRIERLSHEEKVLARIATQMEVDARLKSLESGGSASVKQKPAKTREALSSTSKTL